MRWNNVVLLCGNIQSLIKQNRSQWPTTEASGETSAAFLNKTNISSVICPLLVLFNEAVDAH